jgi:ribosomal protein L11 methyltransferase
MKQWNYLEASCRAADSDKASGVLWDLGTQGVEEVPLSSGRLSLKAYFDPSHDIRRLHHEFRVQCRKARVRLFRCSLRIQAERDWFKKWRQQLQPFVLGSRFQVVPFDKPGLPLVKGRLSICLEPGMAFGTGTHETTQLCLEALERYVTPASTCLDVGTGSGILAIAAFRLGARKVVACDTDPIAIEIAAANGEKNRCASKIRWVLGEIDQVPRFQPDVLVANLTIELIEQKFQKFDQRLKPGSWLILSGVLSNQASRLARLRRKSSLKLKARRKKGEWICLVYRKPYALPKILSFRPTC